MPLRHYPGEGTEPCRGHGINGRPCGNREIEGLEYCLYHIPDEMLEEAEEITGMRRCRERFGQPDACRQVSVTGTDPPACKTHGANLGSRQSQGVARREVENKAADRLAEIMSSNLTILDNPPAIGNPLEAHLAVAAEMMALKDLLRPVVAYLVSQGRIRYAHDRVGEQIRIELLLYERALERVDRVLTNIERARIDDRLAAIKERQVAAIERALVLALEASGLDVHGQDQAVKVLRRELKAIEAPAA